MHVFTIFSFVCFFLFRASLVHADSEALRGRGKLVDSPSMRRVKVRSVVPRTLLQVGSRLDKRACEVICSADGCCDLGYYCDVVQGVRGCCRVGHTCEIGSSNCVTPWYLECNGLDFCCPPNTLCSVGPYGERRCDPPGSDTPPVDSIPLPVPSPTTMPAVVPTPSATIADVTGDSTSTKPITTDEEDVTPPLRNGATGAIPVEKFSLVVIGAASLAITFL
ncbi:hypothetical protein CPB86DRAFT_816255 [Serendipita vermifera]|nr:hypothetical protein CPB86DRAFT_816255 [Serendipita vermifera]